MRNINPLINRIKWRNDMNIKLYSYLFGLLGTDGTVYYNSNKTHISGYHLELIDKDILDKIALLIPNCTQSERIRDTNFKKNYHSYLLTITDKEFAHWTEINGMPLQDKTNNITPPLNEYSESDFWRGVIDGDGSIGMKKVEQQPFISLVTRSESLKNSYADYIYRLTGFKPTCNRNKRDGVFNLTLHGEKALIIANALYNNANIYIDRKYQNYLQIKDWKKKSMKGVVRKKWSAQEEADLLLMSNEEFYNKYPNRTLVAIKGKRQRMKKGGD